MSCTKVMSINTATAAADIKIKLTLMAVSYTHLTLPTTPYV